MKTAVIFSGAGLSAESGIPTFRDSDGLWENHNVTDVASPDGWVNDKSLVLNFYEQRFIACKNCEPNAGHFAIAKLQEKYNVINITQNVDNLLERAGCNNVTHLHGSLAWRKCEHHIDSSMLDGDPNKTCDYKEQQTEPVKLGDLCTKCGGQMRPEVVWFDEPVNFDYEWVKELVKEVKYNDGVFICVGTSAQVYPAAYLIPLFSQVKNKFIVNLKTNRVSDYVLREGKSGEQLPILVEELLK